MNIICFIHSKTWHLYSVHGLPVDLMQLMAEERNLTIDMEDYDRAKQQYQVSLEMKSLPHCLIRMNTFFQNKLEKIKIGHFVMTWSSMNWVWLLLTQSLLSKLFALRRKAAVILTKWAIHCKLSPKNKTLWKLTGTMVQRLLIGRQSTVNREIFVLKMFVG